MCVCSCPSHSLTHQLGAHGAEGIHIQNHAVNAPEDRHQDDQHGLLPDSADRESGGVPLDAEQNQIPGPQVSDLPERGDKRYEQDEAVDIHCRPDNRLDDEEAEPERQSAGSTRELVPAAPTLLDALKGAADPAVT